MLTLWQLSQHQIILWPVGNSNLYIQIAIKDSLIWLSVKMVHFLCPWDCCTCIICKSMNMSVYLVMFTCKTNKKNQVLIDKQGIFTLLWFTVSSGILFLSAFGVSAADAEQTIFVNLLSPLTIVLQHLHYLAVKIRYTAWRWTTLAQL